LSGERLCRRSLSSPSAFTVRETALAALGAAAVTRIGAPTKPLDLDAERATRFCEWIGEVENGKGGQGYVASGDRGGTRAGVRTASKKTLRPQIALAFPRVAMGRRAGNRVGMAVDTRAMLTCATEALMDAVKDAIVSLTTYGRSRAVARVVVNTRRGGHSGLLFRLYP